MNVLFYNTDTSLIRNSFIIQSLRSNMCNIILQKRYSGIKGKLFILLYTLQLLYKRYDVIYLGMGSHPYVLIVKIPALIRNKKIFFDAFVSVYNTEIEDRGRHSYKSFKAKYLWQLDKYACLLSDYIFLDTHSHISYFKHEFKLENSCFKRVLIGSYENKYINTSKKLTFDILFFGNFIPLQGVEVIVESAGMVDQSINFHLIGNGQTFVQCNELLNNLELKNLKFLGSLPHDQVMKYVASCNIGLGIFGKTEKAKRVIPHKAYEVIASSKPLLTGDSTAIREIFKPGKNCLTCEMGSPHSLAKVITDSISDDQKLNKVAVNGFELYKKICTPQKIGADLLNYLKKPI